MKLLALRCSGLLYQSLSALPDPRYTSASLLVIRKHFNQGQAQADGR